MGLPLTALVHFIAVESRSLYLFWGSFQSLARKIAIAAEMRRELGDDYVQDWSDGICIHNQTLSDTVDCVRAGVHEAMWTLHIDEGSVRHCYRHGEPGFSYIGALNISATAVIGLFLLSSLFLLFKSGAKDWQDGEYLYFTWSLGHTKVHRTFAYILVGYTVLAVGAIVVMAYMHNGADDLFLAPEQLIKLTWSDAFSLVFAAGAFLSTHDPAFHWSDPRLRKATFQRPIMDIIKQSNDALGQRIEHAVLKARLGEPEELEKLIGHTLAHPLRELGKDGGRNMGPDVPGTTESSSAALLG